MRHSWLSPSYPVQIVGQPDCSNCGAEMWLVCIEPDAPGFDRRTFECPCCQTQFVKVVRLK